MAKVYAIVYATNNGALRRIIASDQGMNGNEVGPSAVSIHHLANGESVLYVATNQNHGPADWAAQVQAATGMTPPNQTAALIDGTNTVTAVIMADTAIDAAPTGFTMVNCYSPLITVGCTWDSVAQLFTAPGFTIPAGAPGNKGSALPKAIPATVIPRS